MSALFSCCSSPWQPSQFCVLCNMLSITPCCYQHSHQTSCRKLVRWSSPYFKTLEWTHSRLSGNIRPATLCNSSSVTSIDFSLMELDRLWMKLAGASAQYGWVAASQLTWKRTESQSRNGRLLKTTHRQFDQIMAFFRGLRLFVCLIRPERRVCEWIQPALLSAFFVKMLWLE